MPPYPLYSEPNIPGAAGLDTPNATSSPADPQGLQTHSSKFPIEREVILSSTDKNSKIPILHEYKKRTKAAIAPDIPPKQMAAWTQAQGQIPSSHFIGSDQNHSGHVPSSQQNAQHNSSDQSGMYRATYLSSQDYYNAQNSLYSTGAVPRSAWQGGDISRSVQGARQYLQTEEPTNNSSAPPIPMENGKENSHKESNKSSKTVTKTYHTIKDLISSKFKSGKDTTEGKIEEPGLNNVAEELRKSVRSVDRLEMEPPSEDRIGNFKKSAGEQGIYGKPRTDLGMNAHQHPLNQQLIQQQMLAQQAMQSQQVMQQYDMAQQLKSQPHLHPNQQLQQSRSQELLASRQQDQMYYQNSHGSAPQRPLHRYGMSPSSEQNYVMMHHQQHDDTKPNSRDILNEKYGGEKRSAQQLERDNLRQKSFEARRAASQPQLTYEDEVKNEISRNRPQPQIGPTPVRRGSHGNLIEAAQLHTSINDTEKDSDDGGFIKRPFRDGKTDVLQQKPTDNDGQQPLDSHAMQKNEMSYNKDEGRISEALMGTPRKRLEGEIGKIEGVYNLGQKTNAEKDDGRGQKKQNAESAASSDYDKPGQSSSNADSGRGSAAYSSGRRPGGNGIDTSNENSDPHQTTISYKDSYMGHDSEWVDVVENELRTILEPKLHELSLHGNVGIANSTLSESISSMTPPLPPLSPGEQSSPNLTPRNSAKYKRHSSLPYGSKPEYGLDNYNKMSKGASAVGPGVGANRWHGVHSSSAQKHRSGKKVDHGAILRAKQGIFSLDTTDVASTTTRSMDLESMLDNHSDSEGDISTTDARAIRKQLEGLEGMYSEVLKMLGVKKYMGRYQPSDPRFSKRRYGSMSSLPSSSVSSRPIRDKRRMHDDRKKVKDIRGINKRFQRLESHVVTLARSVAHLSSEMRTQHLMIQEMENIRGEIAALRTQTNMLNIRSHSTSRAMNSSKDLPGLANPTRVKKLTKFFGDEPPLLRLFLRKLGYEKYANVFENERVGMVELPYLSEERLQKMGVPLGPRLRILQEAQISVCKDTTLCVV